MSRKWVVVHLTMAAAVLAPCAAQGADPIVYYTFDELGAVMVDKSGHGRDGTPHGGIKLNDNGYVNKCLAFNGTDSYVQLPRPVQDSFTLTAWITASVAGRAGAQAYEGSGIFWSDVAGAANDYVVAALGTKLSFFCGNPDTSVNSSGDIVTGKWVHIAAVRDTKARTISVYINGKLDNTVSHTNVAALNAQQVMALGGNTLDARYFTGLIDEVKIYAAALTVAEIQTSMKSPSLAINVSPASGATDVPRDAILNWKAGQSPATHDVYLGTAFADVNTASRTNPNGVLASQGQAETTFDPAGVFAYGQTYYWRIDEVNKSADATILKGEVWSFTAEPYGYPIASVTATASSAQPSMGPENTINGSGLTGDLHGTEGPTMWLSSGAQPNWIQYQFDKAYKLYDLKVWNSNQLIESFIGFGAKKVTIEYSADGTTWMALANVPEFGRGTGMPGYAANTTVQMGGVMAKFVKLTITGTWGGISPVTGLAEVRFSYVPVQAREPQPAIAATGVAVDPTLNWRPGREAGSHKVFFGTDQAAVAAGTAAAKTVTDHSFAPGSLLFGTTYYWKVDEVNTVTYPGEVWSFTTQEYAAIDNFESYNDDNNRIYDAWIDGYTDGKSGSIVGNMTAPFAEQTILHGGKQSMPFEYNNVKAPYYSEASRTFAATQNWTTNGADTVSLYVRGRAAGFADNGNSAFTISASGADVWGTADQFRFAYKSLSGDGSIVARVDSIVNTNTWAKGGVMIRQSTDAGSTHAFMPITPGGGNGASFQRRLVAAAASTNDDKPAPAIAAPYWVKVERKGNSFTGSISPDGKTWTQLGTAQTIVMTNPVLIGLAVTSHDAALTTTAEISNVSTTGTVTGTWQSLAIGMAMPTNGAAPLYLTVQDKAGKTKTVVNANPSASATAGWTQWKIPLSDLTGVSLTTVQKITLGVGDKVSPKAGAAGMLYFDDLGYGHPAQ